MEKPKSFLDCPSFQKLKSLSLNPPDLTKLITPERIREYQAKSADYKLLFATERVDSEILKSLESLAEERRALEKMEKMQSGEIVNFIEGYPSENRAALHTALRDFFDSGSKSKTALQASQMAKQEVEKLKNFAPEFEKYSDLIVVGIGGSELGPKAAFLALESQAKKGKRVHFLANIDPDDVSAILKDVDTAKTLVLVVSKAGTTLETVTNDNRLRAHFLSKDSFICVTGEGSPMDNKERYKECFYMWDWVGGRFSVTSIISGVIFTFAFGFEVYMSFLQGAHEMDKCALKPSIHENIPLLGALLNIWNHNFLGYTTAAIIPYSRALSRFAAHIQQVEMESNGKGIDKQGEPVAFKTSPIFWGEPGTNAQHSFFQMIHQGTEIVPVEFIGFIEPQNENDQVIEGTTSQEKLLSNLLAQSLALAVGQKSENPNKNFSGNRPSRILFAKKLTPKNLGALFAYYEHSTVFQGFIWNINSFDQEGVQLGKKLANRFLHLFESQRDQRPLEGSDEGSDVEITLFNEFL